MRQPIIAGNWKMNLGKIEGALEFIRQIRQPLQEIKGVERVLCPPFTALHSVAEILSPTQIRLGAQNMHWEEKGAHTGEVAPSMLQGICGYVILGHSERRASGGAGETDEAINLKVQAALEHGLVPIVCVGESLEQKEAGETTAFVGGQVRSAFLGLSPDQMVRCVIAYEPIWAIGTGLAATPADVNSIIGLTVRGMIAENYGEEIAQQVRIQYGGSVNAENIASYMEMPDVDGALVGGASLKPGFVDLVRNGAMAKGMQ